MAGEHAISVRQTARRLSVIIRTLYRWEAAGRRLPATLLSTGQRRFSSRVRLRGSSASGLPVSQPWMPENRLYATHAARR